MISGIGLNAFYSSAAAGASGAASAPNSERDAPVKEKPGVRAPDPVAVKPANIGGSSAIAAQIEASRPTDDEANEKSSGKSRDETDAAGLSEEDRAQVKKLQARDREVRAHEAAHQAVGGQYAGAASFTFQSGPDGRRYAVGGEVPIDIGAVPGDPDATIRKLRIVRRAALAPIEPSAQDRSVAVRAEAGVRQAQTDKRAEAEAERAEAAVETAETSASGPETGPVPQDENSQGEAAQPDSIAGSLLRRTKTDYPSG